MSGEHAPTRRRYLQAVGAASAVAVAGCAGSGTDRDCSEPTSYASTVGVAAADALSVTDATRDWPQGHRDSRNTGATADPGPRRDVVRGWRFEAPDTETDGPVDNAYPVVDGGRVYVGTYEGDALVALDPATGTVEWRYDRLSSGGRVAVLGPADDRLVVAPGADGLHGVDATTGERRWVYGDGSFDHDGNVVATDGAVFANGRNGIHAVEIASGERRWTADGNQVGAATGETLLLGDGPFRALSTADGTERWRVDDTTPYGSIAVRDGTVYVGELGTVEAYALADGTEEWVFEGDTEDFRVPAVTANRVVVGSSWTEVAGGNLYVLDRPDGDLQWCRSYGDRDVHGTAVADGTIFVATDDVVEGLTASGAVRLWVYREQYGNYETPAVTGNLLLVGTGDGAVTAFCEGESAGPVPTPTPDPTPPGTPPE
jgi:outer membrane protein assembly factor BamB